MSIIVHGCGQTHKECAKQYGVDPREASFLCTTCWRRVGWCEGGDDPPDEELCSRCWCKRFAKEKAS
jgi:DNA-directed RNA polymerase subunit RPC12/RpoP